MDNASSDKAYLKVDNRPSTNNYETLEQLQTFTVMNFKTKGINYHIEKLYELITDPVTEENQAWIDRLLRNYLRDVESNGYKVKHLVYVNEVLRFLTSKSSHFLQYRIHLNKMLELCALPPLLEKSSDSLSCAEVLKEYFNVLGCLLYLLPTFSEIQKLLEAIYQLLIRTKLVNISAVKFDLCRRILVKSELPIIFCKFIKDCPSEVWKNAFDIMQVLASTSSTCCHKMLAAGIFDTLLLKLIEPFSMETDCQEIMFKNNDTIVIIKMIWTLIKSILPPKSPELLANIPVPIFHTMKSLQGVFKSYVLASRNNEEMAMIRNDLAAIILTGLIYLPSWPLLHCGLANDIISLVSLTESFSSTTENLFFKKILLTFLCQFSTSSGLIYVMKESDILEVILKLLTAEASEKSSCSISWILGTLSCLAPKMPDEFLKCRGSETLIKMLKKNMAANVKETTEEITKTICTLVRSKCPALLADFHHNCAIELILKLMERIVIASQLTMYHQRIVTLFILILEEVISTNIKAIELNIDPIIKLITNLLTRCHDKNDSPKDERLLITVGSFIWKCIVWSPIVIERFIEIGGTYIMLDIIEQTNLHVQNVYFGALVDLCSNSCAVSHICTWRGIDKSKGLVSLLARSWRKEENYYKVKRTREGCIEDVELPITGAAEDTDDKQINQEFSPGIATMFGSVRPKIYSMRKILLTNSELCDKFKEHYKVLLSDLPLEDSITLCIIDQYFRFMQGQVWSEVDILLRQIGTNPLSQDGELVALMLQRYRGCAVYVRECQEKLLKNARKREIIREREELNKIRHQ